MKSRKNPGERHSFRRQQLHVSIERIFMANVHLGSTYHPWPPSSFSASERTRIEIPLCLRNWARPDSGPSPVRPTDFGDRGKSGFSVQSPKHDQEAWQHRYSRVSTLQRRDRLILSPTERAVLRKECLPTRFPSSATLRPLLERTTPA
jgi:hypothetical protein